MDFNKMISLLPQEIEKQKVRCYPDWQDALTYLEDILENNRHVNMLVNIDSDCFITNWSAIESLLAYMQAKQIAYAGIYDSNDYIPHRKQSKANHESVLLYF